MASTLKQINVYKKSSRKGAKIAKDAKLLFAVLSLYFQDSNCFEGNISCKTRIYRIETLRLCALARENSGILFEKFKMLQTTSTLKQINIYNEFTTNHTNDTNFLLISCHCLCWFVLFNRAQRAKVPLLMVCGKKY